MGQIFLTYILPPLISLIFGLVSAFVIAKMNQKLKKDEQQLQAEEQRRKAEHQAYLNQKEQERCENNRNQIREEIEPIVKEIAYIHVELEALATKVTGCEETETRHIAAIRVSYRYRLITLCRTYLRQGYMTAAQFDQLNEFFQVYRAIGGNGQAEEYYNKVAALEIRNEEEAK